MSDEIFECEFCGENFSSMEARRSYHKKTMKNCEKMYIWQSQILRRVTKKSHPNGKMIRTEDIATKKTEKFTNIKPNYFCALCGKMFVIESKLNLHKEKNHGQFTCFECNKCYVSEEMLTSHVNKSSTVLTAKTHSQKKLF